MCCCILGGVVLGFVGGMAETKREVHWRQRVVKFLARSALSFSVFVALKHLTGIKFCGSSGWNMVFKGVVLITASTLISTVTWIGIEKLLAKWRTRNVHSPV
jgi:peptidoglycan/LPS O-acetylase OafA/YrhL